MADILIDSQGFSIGRWQFPSFTLRRGECIAMRFPREAVACVDQDHIVSCLTGRESVPGLDVHATVHYAKPASSPSGWRRWFRDPTPLVWLKINTALADDAIRALLLEHNIDRNIPLSRCAGTPKMILGMEAAYAHTPQVVVFSTMGLDPRGAAQVSRFVAEHLPECSAIYLAWPFSCQGRMEDVSFPGFSGVTVIDKPQPTFAHN